MRFKMAPNSLFAILLRSRWWASLAISAGFVLVAHALAPAEYRVLASMGALPFFVIAMIAAWRQARAPSPARIEKALERVAAMGWEEFAGLLTAGFARQGQQVQALPAGAAADLRLEYAGSVRLVAARRWKAARLGEEALTTLLRARSAQQADGCVYVALGQLSPQARKLAERERVDVLTGERLVVLLGL